MLDTLAAQAPDPGDPAFCTLTGALLGAVATTLAIARHRHRADVEWAGFTGAFAGVVIGLVTYLIGLISGLC